MDCAWKKLTGGTGRDHRYSEIRVFAAQARCFPESKSPDLHRGFSNDLAKRGLSPLDLPVFELHGRIAAEDAHRDAQLAALRVDLLDDAVLVLERTVRDLDLVADLELDLRLHVVL